MREISQNESSDIFIIQTGRNKKKKNWEALKISI